MSQDIHPWSFLSASVGVGILTDGWNLAEPYQPDEGGRSFVTDVVFDAPFGWRPLVNLGMTGFDIDERGSSRVTLSAEEVTAYGFRARISTWSNTRVYSVEFNWLAIGAAPGFSG